LRASIIMSEPLGKLDTFGAKSFYRGLFIKFYSFRLKVVSNFSL